MQATKGRLCLPLGHYNVNVDGRLNEGLRQLWGWATLVLPNPLPSVN
jgi:hypothetical protein